MDTKQSTELTFTNLEPISNVILDNITMRDDKVFYEYTELNNKISLGIGIKKYFNDDKTISVILKTLYNCESVEPKLIKLDNLKKLLITSRIISGKKYDYIATIAFDCDLRKFVENQKLNDKNILEIMNIITNNIFSLYKLGFYYTDIKLDNILISKYNENNCYSVVLCDYDSIVSINEKPNMTYPGINIENNEQMIVFGLCLLFLSLYNIDIGNLYDTQYDCIDDTSILNIQRTKTVIDELENKSIKTFLSENLLNKLYSFKNFLLEIKNLNTLHI